MREDEKVSFVEHLEELRKRLIICIVAVVIGFAITYSFKVTLFKILTGPLVSAMNETSGDIIYTSLPEPFFTYLKVSLIAGLLLSAPVIFYQFWMFIAPGLYSNERKLIVPVVFLSSFFFVGGALFGYFVVFPFGFRFFLGFSNDTIHPMLSMKEYLSFSSKLLLAFGISFELPLVEVFLARLGILSVDFLKKNRKYAIVIIFIASAILTPQDVVSQIIMAVPLMFLYEIGILGAKIYGKKNSNEEASAYNA